MTASAAALTVTGAIVFLGVGIALFAGARRTMTLEQWAVGGRGFGPLLMYLLMAGEVYTTFSFLGASGWAYSRGGPTLYILAYITLAYVVSFFILPPIWELGHRHGLHTEADFFSHRYGSTALGAVVSIVGVVFIIPYLQLQLTGLGIIVEVASSEGISRATAMAIGVALIIGFVLVSGVRAVARLSVLKDALMLIAVVSIGILVPRAYFGGIGPMFTALAAAKPAHLTMPGATANLGHAWYISTVLLTACGFYMWPHGFTATFTARSADTLRRNAVIMPLYTVCLAFVFFVGFTAVLVVPGLRDGDLSLLMIVRRTFSPWFLGFVGGAGALTAMVPGAVFILTAATLFSKNLVRPIFAPAMTDDQVARLAKLMVVVIGLVSLYFAIFSATTLVGLLLLGYAGVTQFFPGVVLGLYSRRVTTAGVFAGIVAGVAAVAALMLTGRDPFIGLSAGFVALCINFAVVGVVSSVTRRPSSQRAAQRDYVH